jgi:hypothetical protein
MTTAIIGLIGVVLGAAISSALTYFLQKAADDRRWEREAEQRRLEWHRENEYRDYHERRQAYSEFMASTDRLFAGDGSLEAFKQYRVCEAAVRLIATAEVEKAADVLGYRARGAASGAPVGNAEYGGALQDFLRAAREDLGKPPPPWP